MEREDPHFNCAPHSAWDNCLSSTRNRPFTGRPARRAIRFGIRPQTLKVTGGTPPYSFSVSRKSCCRNSLIDIGVLSGTPTVTGGYSFTITAQESPMDPVDPDLKSGSRDYKLTVDPAPLTITANNATMDYGGPVPALSVSYAGFVNGDNSSNLTKEPTTKTTATSSSPPGTYSITVSGAEDPKYSMVYEPGMITKASQRIDWTQNLLMGCVSITQIQLTAASSSGLPVSYSVSDPNVATVSGNLLHAAAIRYRRRYRHSDRERRLYCRPGRCRHRLLFIGFLITEHWNDVLFFDNSSGDYVGWQWYKNGVAVPGDTTSDYTESSSLDGQYYVIATAQGRSATKAAR